MKALDCLQMFIAGMMLAHAVEEEAIGIGLAAIILTAISLIRVLHEINEES